MIGILAQAGYCLGVYRAADLGVLPGTSALVASLQPPLVAAVLWAGSGGRTDRRQALGLLTGLAGVLLVVGGDLGGAGGTAGLTAVGLGTLSLTAATLVASRWPEPPGHGVMDSLAVQYVVALGFFAAVALATGTAAPPRDGDFWLAIAWLVLLPVFGGYGSYLYVLRTSGPVVVSAWLYLTPATAAVWAWSMFDVTLPLTPPSVSWSRRRGWRPSYGRPDRTCVIPARQHTRSAIDGGPHLAESPRPPPDQSRRKRGMTRHHLWWVSRLGSYVRMAKVTLLSAWTVMA